MNLTFALWNAEWLNELFEGNPPVFKDLNEQGYMTRQKIGDRVNDINGVVNEINADVWVIVEGPNQTSELQLFFDQASINGDFVCAVQPSGAQSLGIAVRKDPNIFAQSPLTFHDINTSQVATKLKEATNDFFMDTDGDKLEERHKFERRPLYATIHLANGIDFRVLGLHLKSKGIFQSLEWSRWWTRAEGNRKRIVAQCQQLRENFLDPFLSDPQTKDIPLIVCGDINDGPGFDTSEMKLSASGIERLMGSIWHPELCLNNASFDTLSPEDQRNLDFSSLYTANFADPIFNRTYRRVWIDHILYSCKAKNWISQAKIHTHDSAGQPYYAKYPKASDHSPVTCTITL